MVVESISEQNRRQNWEGKNNWSMDEQQQKQKERW